MLELKNISYFYKSQKDKMVLEQIPYQFENGKMYTALDERIREERGAKELRIDENF